MALKHLHCAVCASAAVTFPSSFLHFFETSSRRPGSCTPRIAYRGRVRRFISLARPSTLSRKLQRRRQLCYNEHQDHSVGRSLGVILIRDYKAQLRPLEITTKALQNTNVVDLFEEIHRGITE